MLLSKIPLATLLQGILLGYILVSLVYTTGFIIASPAVSAVFALVGVEISGSESLAFPKVAPRVDLIAHAHQVFSSSHPSWGADTYSSLRDLASSSDWLYWNLPALGPLSGSLDDAHAGTLPVQEGTLLSKAFAQALHPTEFIPFYYKATGPVDTSDVTITTLVTSNRYKVLKQLVEQYKGPISVTIYIPLPPPTASASETSQFIIAVQDLDALYASSPHFAAYVDVHLALSPLSSAPHATSGSTEGGRQFNVWRNAARLFARSEFVMMLDVDFAVCTDWRSVVRGAVARSGLPHTTVGSELPEPTPLPGKREEVRQVVQKVREGAAALVVPAFEYTKQGDGADHTRFPKDKESLRRLATGPHPKLDMFHASWAPGHNSTDYTRYLSTPSNSQSLYKVITYQSAYEPYVIMSKRVPWCDERFTGYGGNKAACLFEIYLSGVDFYVMADHFLIHQSHKYEEEARREERKYNRKLYADFKEEACLRYLYRFHSAGQLRTSVAANAVQECKKVKSVEKLASELLGESL
ncbi:glycosyltransferase family 49 protein [Phanerochaete carnosa HHB-10118-sp]|uniref:Glycosyltransferase family 49 protein n=1 Tax=Phanerochaete carnosa (strain HHB-10118-sp) TaxID=650164 RepID=K5W1L7_PHACS|nr:glycosyltransferase family 49 protein [Phanerochaete carnosa HHB-10118-sp]EKM52779.1 glycosyltransferase family 49 protein [Phanerochaete carnosa HHB-10118-sp]